MLHLSSMFDLPLKHLKYYSGSGCRSTITLCNAEYSQLKNS